jgi:hypothetical protein
VDRFSAEVFHFEVTTMESGRLNGSQRPQLQWSAGAARAIMLMAFLLVLPLGGAQNTPTGHIGGLPQPFGVPGGESPLGDVNNRNPEDPEQARRIRLLNTERQKSLVADTVKLLRLANELNASMAKEDAPAATPDELRKVADIERLAHNVKEKMKITVIGTPTYRNPDLPQTP